jgi:hypothetical protein
MASDVFDKYLAEINEAYLRGDATENTHRVGLLGDNDARWGTVDTLKRSGGRKDYD